MAAPDARRRLRWEAGVSVVGVGATAGAIVLLANVPTLLPFIHRRTHFWQNLPVGAPQTWVPLLLIALTGLALTQVRRPRGLWLLTGLVAFDLGVYCVSFNPSIHPQVLSATPNSVRFLKKDPSPYRTATFMIDAWASVPKEQAQLAFSWNIAYQIASVNGFNSLEPRRYVDLLIGPAQEDVSYGYLRDPGLLRSSNALLSLLNVKYVLFPPDDILPLGPHFRPVFADQDVAIYRNDDVLPRAFWATVVEPATSHEILTALRAGSVDPHRTALVENIPPALADSLQAIEPGGPITVNIPGPNRVVITATTSAPRFLVVSEPWFRGWEAYIDDELVPTYRTNYLLRGIVVPEGVHTITFRYRPVSVQVGTIMSSMTLLLCGLALLRKRRVTSANPPALQMHHRVRYDFDRGSS
jgi:hypothetical protein